MFSCWRRSSGAVSRVAASTRLRYCSSTASAPTEASASPQQAAQPVSAEYLGPLYQLVHQTQHSATPSAQRGEVSLLSETRLPRSSQDPTAPLLQPLQISDLMMHLPSDLKKLIKAQGGLVRTLKRHREVFAMSETGLEVGVVGKTIPFKSYRTQEPINLVGVDSQEPTLSNRAPRVQGSSNQGVKYDRTISRGPTVVASPSPAPPLVPRKITAVYTAPKRLPMNWRRNGSIVTTPAGCIDLNAPPLNVADVQQCRQWLQTAGDYLWEAGDGTEESAKDRLAVDASYYAEKGLPTPEEMIELFAPYVPTFPVPLHQWGKGLPVKLNALLKQHGKNQTFFKKYPMVFKVGGSKYHGFTLQVSPGLKHKEKGRCDKYYGKFREKPAEMVEDKKRDAEIATLIHKNLKAQQQPKKKEESTAAKTAPGAAADTAGLFEFMSLVEFVNSFSPDDLEMLNKDPPERVVTVVRQRPALFQLLTGYPSLADTEYQDVANDEGDSHPSKKRKAGLVGTSAGDSDQPSYALTDYFIRLKPPTIAPAALGNFCQHSTPDSELLEAIAGVVPYSTAPVVIPKAPAAGGVSGPATPGGALNPLTRRWIKIEDLYADLSIDQRKDVKNRFKSLVSFLRMHGKLYHVSPDKAHVIEHIPYQDPPLLGTMDKDLDHMLLQTKVGVSLSGLSSGASGVPKTRSELALMDPNNALLDNDVLCDEIHKLMPDHPVPLLKLITALPPIMRAAVPNKKPIKLFQGCPEKFSTWMSSPGIFSVQKAELGPAPKGYGLNETTSNIADVVSIIRTFVPSLGIKVGNLHLKIPPAARNAVNSQGGMADFLASMPQYFVVDTSESPVGIVYLVEDIKGRRR